MKIIRVYRKDRIVDVIIALDKITNKYRFINLTDEDICTCQFDTMNDAIIDLNNRKEVLYYKIIDLITK